MERIFFDRIVKLLVTCPHFRGLDIYIDSVEGLEIYSAPYIFGILPRDWDRIRNETNLFDIAGHISRTHWQKIVNSTTESKSTNMRYKIIIATGKTNYKGNRYRTFNLSFSDTGVYSSLRRCLIIGFVSFDSNVLTCSLWSSLPTITIVLVIAIAITIVITVSILLLSIRTQSPLRTISRGTTWCICA